jgi:hypothetical protein
MENNPKPKWKESDVHAPAAKSQNHSRVDSLEHPMHGCVKIG